ncbi:unnamed protein product [Allacma fusca]|uniref:Uncharacterized protein n=1 Tax=Allacma fusca TaxID=39272 RepID=A0A8J2PEM5_9HEXA|nr:unnamed protein product [Allacma fusca]
MDARQESLFAWVATLPTYSSSRKIPKPGDFQDGIILGRILKEVIDPVSFSDLNTSPNNPTPLATIIDKMKRYFAQQERGHIIPFNLTPNPGKIITSGDTKEICRLLQLLVVCAVNCPSAEKFITDLQSLTGQLQGEIMSAIKELMASEEEREDPTTNLEVQLRKALGEIVLLNDTKEQLTQTCHELNVKLSQLTEEKTALITENEKLSSQLAGHLNDPESIHMSIKLQEEARKEADHLREENYKLESTLDDYKLKLQVLEKQISEAHAKLASVAAAEEEIVRLKDEIDSLGEAAAKVTLYEQTINVYKKRLEEMADLKLSMKQLQEKNEELDKKNFNMEEELKKVNTWKTQLDAVKKELAETQQRLSQEQQRALKAEFDFRHYREKFENSIGATERLKEENKRLILQLDELGVPDQRNQSDLDKLPSGSSDLCSIELLPPVIRQKLLRLELENQKLKEDLKAAVDANPSEVGVRVLLDELRKREAELEENLLKKDQEMVDMQSSQEEKVRLLKSQISAKDEEIERMRKQYHKCMEKAKSVIVTLEPTAAAGLDTSKTDGEIEKARAVREMEEKLLASAFYNYGLTMHRNTVEARNTTLLQRHRMSASSRRKSEI